MCSVNCVVAPDVGIDRAAYLKSSLASGSPLHRYAAQPAAASEAFVGLSSLACRQVDATTLELQARVELPAREGASAATSRREEGPSKCNAVLEVTATLGEDPKRNRNSRARGVGSILESRTGGLTCHTIQRPEFSCEQKRARVAIASSEFIPLGSWIPFPKKTGVTHESNYSPTYLGNSARKGV